MKVKATEPASEVIEPTDIFEGESEMSEEEMPVGIDLDSCDTPSNSSDKKMTTMKVIVWFCLFNGIAWYGAAIFLRG